MRHKTRSRSLSTLRSLILFVSLPHSLLYGSWALAQLDPASQQALEQTRELLKNPNKIEQDKSLSPEARQAHNNAKALMGSDEGTRELYSLAGDVISMIAEKAKGDPAVMQKMLQEFSQNPEAFFKALSPEQREKMKFLAQKAEAHKSRQPATASPPK